jgi:sulfonate transport system substrate-binding protein
MKLRVLLPILFTFVLASGWAEDKPSVIRLDYATYNPVSLVLKSKGWAEEAFAKEGIKVEWTLSQGSNRALEFLNGNSVDFGSTAGAAALISRSNGNPIYGVYLYSKPEWAALVTLPGSGITKIADLKGKKVAATLGTDPYIFLLRALDTVGLKASDVQIVSLQHADGATALVGKQVDAWAGLDPHIARLEVDNGAVLFYRNPDFNTYGVLNVRKEFAEKYPSYVQKVIALYDKAKAYSKANQAELINILAAEAKIKPEIAKIQIAQRTDLSVAVPGDDLKKALQAAAVILLKGGQIKAGTDTDAVIADYIRPNFAAAAAAQKP